MKTSLIVLFILATSYAAIAQIKCDDNDKAGVCGPHPQPCPHGQMCNLGENSSVAAVNDRTANYLAEQMKQQCNQNWQWNTGGDVVCIDPGFRPWCSRVGTYDGWKCICCPSTFD